jgi:hypothetical protein
MRQASILSRLIIHGSRRGMSRIKRRGQAKLRNRRLYLEPLEDRRLLAMANDDSYFMETGGTLTVNGDGAWGNDEYDRTWTDTFWGCTDNEWHEGYWDENNEWHDGYWECHQEGWVTMVQHASGGLASSPSHGSLTQIDSGDYYYDDYGNVLGQYGLAFIYVPEAGFTGFDSFSYMLSDDEGSGTASVTIRVQGPPIAAGDAYEIFQDTQLVVDSPGVLGNDDSAYGDSFTAVLVAGPTHGTLTFNGDGSFTYTPVEGLVGADSFTYRADNGYGQSEEATVSITVRRPMPVAMNDSYSFYSAGSSALTVDASVGVLANDTNPLGSDLLAGLVTGPSHGSLSLNTTGAFSYTPAANFYGNDRFTYRVFNGVDYSEPASVTLRVLRPNEAPIANWDSYQTVMDTPLSVLSGGVLANDSDGDGDGLTASLVTGPSQGTLSFHPNGTFTYTPSSGYSGLDAFYYRAFDGFVYSSSTVVWLRVDAAPRQWTIRTSRQRPMVPYRPCGAFSSTICSRMCTPLRRHSWIRPRTAH